MFSPKPVPPHLLILFLEDGRKVNDPIFQEVSPIIPESRHFPLTQLFPLASQLIILEIMKCLICKIAFPIHYSPFSILSTSILTQAFITFSLDCCNNLLDPPASSLPPLQSILHFTGKDFFLLYKHSHAPSLLEFHEWLPINIKYEDQKSFSCLEHPCYSCTKVFSWGMRCP